MVVQRYTFRCDCPGCDFEEADVTPLPRETPQSMDMWPPKPVLPFGWRLLDEHIVCPRHRIAVDGQTTQFGTFTALASLEP